MSSQVDAPLILTGNSHSQVLLLSKNKDQDEEAVANSNTSNNFQRGKLNSDEQEDDLSIPQWKREFLEKKKELLLHQQEQRRKRFGHEVEMLKVNQNGSQSNINSNANSDPRSSTVSLNNNHIQESKTDEKSSHHRDHHVYPHPPNSNLIINSTSHSLTSSIKNESKCDNVENDHSLNGSNTFYKPDNFSSIGQIAHNDKGNYEVDNNLRHSIVQNDNTDRLISDGVASTDSDSDDEAGKQGGYSVLAGRRLTHAEVSSESSEGLNSPETEESDTEGSADFKYQPGFVSKMLSKWSTISYPTVNTDTAYSRSSSLSSRPNSVHHTTKPTKVAQLRVTRSTSADSMSTSQRPSTMTLPSTTSSSLKSQTVVKSNSFTPPTQATEPNKTLSFHRNVNDIVLIESKSSKEVIPQSKSESLDSSASTSPVNVTSALPLDKPVIIVQSSHAAKL